MLAPGLLPASAMTLVPFLLKPKPCRCICMMMCNNSCVADACRRALRKSLQTAASPDHIAALRLTLAQALQSAANSSPGIPLARQEQYSEEALTLLQASAASNNVTALYCLALLQVSF